MNIIKGRIGHRAKKTAAAHPTLSLLRSFLSDEEIFGYGPSKKNSSALFDEWKNDWSQLLEMVTKSYKSKIKYVHPDIAKGCKKTEDVASNLTTEFNILKTRIREKMGKSPLVKRLTKNKKEKQCVGVKVLECTCGKTFIQTGSYHKFCSINCRHEERKRREKRNRIPYSVTRNCKFCNAEFKATGYAKLKTYCNKNCWSQHVKQKKAQQIKIQTCIVCGSKFQVRTYKKKVCSEKCISINYEKNQKKYYRKRRLLRAKKSVSLSKDSLS